MSVTWGSNLDLRAERLAKIALGWDNLTVEEKMDRSNELILRTEQIKEVL